jgi:hypothetical protein
MGVVGLVGKDQASDAGAWGNAVGVVKDLIAALVVAQPAWIRPAQRVAAGVALPGQVVERVGSEELAGRRVIVPCLQVLEAGLGVGVLAREAEGRVGGAGGCGDTARQPGDGAPDNSGRGPALWLQETLSMLRRHEITLTVPSLTAKDVATYDSSTRLTQKCEKLPDHSTTNSTVRS